MLISKRNSSRMGSGWIDGVIVIATLVLIAFWLPRFLKARTTSGANACINNLRQLDGAKQQWAIENKKATNDIPLQTDLDAYLKSPLVCPDGGIYSINSVVADPTCTLSNRPGHSLPRTTVNVP